MRHCRGGSSFHPFAPTSTCSPVDPHHVDTFRVVRRTPSKQSRFTASFEDSGSRQSVWHDATRGDHTVTTRYRHEKAEIPTVTLLQKNNRSNQGSPDISITSTPLRWSLTTIRRSYKADLHD